MPIGKTLQKLWWNVEHKERSHRGEEHVLSPEMLNKLEMISVNIPIQYHQKNISDGKFVYFF